MTDWADVVILAAMFVTIVGTLWALQRGGETHE